MAAATATLGVQSIGFSRFPAGIAMVINTEYNKGVFIFSSMQILFIERLRISLVLHFLSNDRFPTGLDETMLRHSCERCFSIHWNSSVLISLTQKQAEAISFQVPLKRARPRGSTLGFSLRCLVWDGHETTIYIMEIYVHSIQSDNNYKVTIIYIYIYIIMFRCL